MVKPNVHYKELQSSYLFYNISLKTKAYCEAHPGTKLLRLGVGDVTLPTLRRSHQGSARGGGGPGTQGAFSRLYA